jgi:hypothetical protein
VQQHRGGGARATHLDEIWKVRFETTGTKRFSEVAPRRDRVLHDKDSGDNPVLLRITSRRQGFFYFFFKKGCASQRLERCGSLFFLFTGKKKRLKVQSTPHREVAGVQECKSDTSGFIKIEI